MTNEPGFSPKEVPGTESPLIKDTELVPQEELSETDNRVNYLNRLITAVLLILAATGLVLAPKEIRNSISHLLANNISTLATEIPDSAFKFTPTDPDLKQIEDLLTLTPSATTTESSTPTETSTPEPNYFELQNRLIQYKENENKASHFGGSFWNMYQDRSGNMYIIATSKDPEHPENASLIEVKDPDAQTINTNRHMAGIELPEGFQLPNGETIPPGSFLYNFRLFEGNTTRLLILNRNNKTIQNFSVRNNAGRRVNLFQLVRSNEAYSTDDDQIGQGIYVGIQSFYESIYGTPTPTPIPLPEDSPESSVSQNNRVALAKQNLKNLGRDRKRARKIYKQGGLY